MKSEMFNKRGHENGLLYQVGAKTCAPERGRAQLDHGFFVRVGRGGDKTLKFVAEDAQLHFVFSCELGFVVEQVAHLEVLVIELLEFEVVFDHGQPRVAEHVEVYYERILVVFELALGGGRQGRFVLGYDVVAVQLIKSQRRGTLSSFRQQKNN